MIEGEFYKSKYDLKELELNSLLEITQAINNNMPEESLYKIYDFTIRPNLNIKKLALFVLDDKWECKVNFGTSTDFHHCQFETSFLKYNKIQPLLAENGSPFSEFQTIIPIAHKDKKLAFVFVSGYDDSSNEQVNTNFIQALSNIIIVAIENKKLARKQIEQEMIRKELEIAGNIQQFLFPKKLPNEPGLRASAFYRPHHTIGGDYYDFIEIAENQFLFCIADVSGKGIPAALLMSNFQASLRTLTRQTTLLQEIVTELNYQVMYNAEGQHFITFFVAMYEKNNLRLKYVNCGHNPPVLIRNGQETEFLNDGTTVLGVFKELPFLNVGVIEPISKFSICAFTDGLTEIANARGEEFGQEALSRVIGEYKKDSPEKLNEMVVAAMEKYKGNTSYIDDITLFTCKVDVEQL